MHIYLFSPIRYESLHQRPQKLAEQFLAKGVRVTFVQPTGFRDLRYEQRPCLFVLQSIFFHLAGVLLSMLSIHPRRRKPKRGVGELEVVSLPVTLPHNRFNAPFLEAWNAAVFRYILLSRILADDGEAPVAFVEHPFWGKVVKRTDFRIICYDCLDDLSLFAGNASLERFTRYESRLIELADTLIVTAEKLEQQLRVRTTKGICRIPNGVDYEWFQEQAQRAEVPPECAALPRPIVGYVGMIAGWMDYDMVATVAQKLTHVAFVFVGPLEDSSRLTQLARVPNIHWINRKPYADIPSFIQSFDACIIPFRAGAIAATTNPVKVFEYFALGKPVVTTELEELKTFVREGLLHMAASPEEFAQALVASLHEDDPTLRQRRQETARLHCWRRHAESILDAIEHARGTASC
ncbi:MAG: hypothetical protein C4326_06890 [Ignavibacteria bacterium]